MPNIFTSLLKTYQKTNKKVGQASLILSILAFGALILYTINYSGGNNQVTDNIYANFACKMSAPEDLVELNTDLLVTDYDLTLANIDTELFKTANSKNEIPAIFKPEFVSLDEAIPCLAETELVIVVKKDNVVKAYPKKILNYHVVVNDMVGSEAIILTYSPLANHFAVYSRMIKGEPLEFGVSGDLYKNADLLFDSKTESLWSQLNGKALVGNMIGAELPRLEFEMLQIKDLAAKYPNIQVLSFATGYLRDYNTDPFVGFALDETTIAPPLYTSKQIAQKSMVLGFKIGDINYAVEVSKLTEGENIFKASNEEIRINKIADNYTVRSNGVKAKPQLLYWYVWYDLNPATVVL